MSEWVPVLGMVAAAGLATVGSACLRASRWLVRRCCVDVELVELWGEDLALDAHPELAELGEDLDVVIRAQE